VAVVAHMQRLLNRAVLPVLKDMLLDQPSCTVNMVLPSVLAAVDLMSPHDYNWLVRHDMKKLISTTRSAEVNGKMVNGSRYYRALKSTSIASALSSALTIYACQICVHQNADSLKLQLLTARKKEWWPATADSLPQAVTCQL